MKIDEKKIRREYKKLLGEYYHLFYNPLDDYFNDCGWILELSDRSRGKTTNLLLLGMLLHKHYKIIPHYIRRREKEDLAPKTLKDLFKTIVEFGYIEKLTDGKYNDVIYNSRRWYYVKRTENGIEDQAQEHFMMCMGIDNADSYKSTYNCPTGDFVLLDEMIPLKQSKYIDDEFILLLDILKTVFRDRLGCKIFAVSNVISRYSPYFVEIGCQREIQKLKAGDSFIHTTSIGTKVKVEFMAASQSKVRQLVNSRYFGFENPKLGMLNNAQWQLKVYPHPLFRVKDTELIDKNIFIKHAEQLVQIEIRISEEKGLFAILHNSTTILEDLKHKPLIYTLENESDYNYHFALGFTSFDKRIWQLYQRNRFYYADNDVGELVEDYINKSLKVRR